MKKFYLLFLLILLACSEKNESLSESSDKVISINLLESFSTRGKIKASLFLENIEYIPLETRPESFFTRAPRITIQDDSIIVARSFRKIVLFNLKNGEFIREIGHYGEDPEAYVSSHEKLKGVHKPGVVYARGKKGLIGYSIKTGKKVDFIADPINTDNYQSSEISQYVFKDKNTVSAYFANGSGRQKLRLINYSRQGEILGLFENPNSYDNDPYFTFWRPNDYGFYHFNKELFFFETFVDTVFQVGEKELEPHIVFNAGDRSPPYEKMEYLAKKENADKALEYFYVNNLLETENSIFYKFDFQDDEYYGFFNKEEQQNYVSDLSELNGSGFMNDVSEEFVSFKPKLAYGDKIIGLLSVEEVKEWFKNNRELAKKLPKKLKDLQKLEMEDNPILMIGELK
ncbi:6-bladed beta-propeller [uncultured Roseivirga sp.]|uniref:6-bladed beta-propeller n=1 Tax=uncultured Roseivirga sp. TaxID=543088 RepID=UPI000D7B3517|nr:6-bladed beta-propeller [uncultured Roseivirga sp.]PWL30194.1 MAG: hypothetical protein DCO95_10205 [Roseivirga sp. XM-24bin3]